MVKLYCVDCSKQIEDSKDCMYCNCPLCKEQKNNVLMCFSCFCSALLRGDAKQEQYICYQHLKYDVMSDDESDNNMDTSDDDYDMNDIILNKPLIIGTVLLCLSVLSFAINN